MMIVILLAALGITSPSNEQCHSFGDWMMQLTAVFVEVPEGYIAFVEELPGANTQGASLEEARENLKEAVAMVFEANRELAEKSLVNQKVTKEPFVLSSL